METDAPHPTPDREPAPYLHGTDPEEQRRLSDLNVLMNDACLREIRVPRGARILDLGTGLGQLARLFAREAGPSGFVLGVERNAEQIAEALRQAGEEGTGEAASFEIRRGQAALPPLRDEEWGSFDIAHARFLLEHVPDPLAIVRTMLRATRPGGRVVLADDDHDLLRLWPEPAGVREVWDAYVRTYERIGCDPYVGRRLVSLLHAAGARPSRATWVFFGACAGEDRFAAFVSNLERVLAGARPEVIERSFLDPDLFETALASLRAWGRRPDAVIWYAIAWAEGVRG
jgi:ubiquinone/menaquinone biosynthesis C-methylase UbiE